jgi:hypothetical protein
MARPVQRSDTDREVESEFVEAFITELGEHCDRAVACVPGGRSPESLLRATLLAPLFGALTEDVCDALVAVDKGLRNGLARDVLQTVNYRRAELEVAAISVEDRTGQAVVDILGSAVARHDHSPFLAAWSARYKQSRVQYRRYRKVRRIEKVMEKQRLPGGLFATLLCRSTRSCTAL